MKNSVVLIAEDEPYIRMAYQIGLEHEGYEVVVAENGVKALEKAATHNPDLILLDLLMPKKNGFEVLSDLKEDPNVRDIPVIVLTNLSQATDEKEVRRLGAVDFVVKSDHSLKDVLGIIGKWAP